MTYNVLVVEDEVAVAASLRDLLAREGFHVEVVGSIASARAALATGRAHVMLLDWRLPDGEGIDLLRDLRRTSDLPVLMVTARVEVVDRVLGLELGADDYVTKPIEPRELIARIRSRLRPKGRPLAPSRLIAHGGVTIDPDTREVHHLGVRVDLTRMELNLLALLLAHPGRVFTREDLLNQVWGYERTPTTRTVDTHVAELRTKLFPELIQSVRGVGYRVVRDLTESG